MSSAYKSIDFFVFEIKIEDEDVRNSNSRLISNPARGKEIWL